MERPLVRLATAADVAALRPMMAAFNAAEGISWHPAAVEAALRRLLAEPALGCVPLLEQAGRPAGYAVATLGYDLEYHGHDAYLTELWVEPWARGCGLGRTLLSEAEQRMRAAGARAMHLGVRPDNSAALALYRHAGYEPSRLRMLSRRLS